MKVNSKDISKNKTHKVDQLVKSKIDILNLYAPPIEGWDKGATWRIIKSKLQTPNKLITAWGFSVAASISLLVAASFTIDYNLIDFSKKPSTMVVESTPVETFQTTKQNIGSHQYARPDAMPQVKPSLRLIQATTNSIAQIDVHDLRPTSNNLPELSKRINEPAFAPYFSLHHSGINGTMPNIGLDIPVFSKEKNNISHKLNLGASMSFQIIQNESNQKTKLLPSMNLSYDRINKNNEKGWNVRAAYTIHPDSNVYKTNTMRLSLNRQFNRHIKAGPELIFTKGLKKVYPGISIVFS